MNDVTVTIIEARPKRLGARLIALWQYRGFYSYLLKEITLRKARGTVLGFWWLILRPLIPITTLVVVFTVIVPVNTTGVPYLIFFLPGFAVWQMWQGTVVLMARTMQWMRSLMRRTYFPRLLVPLASVGPPLIELAIIVILFVGALIYFYFTTGSTHLRVGWEMLLFPLCLFLSLALAVAIGMVVGVTALFFRDIRYTIRYVAQILMFLTPVVYPVGAVPEPWRWIMLTLNPLAEIVETARWSLTGKGDFDPFFFAVAVGVELIIVSLCVGFFLRAETYLADEL